MTARLATTTTTRTATSGTVETCRLTRSWNKTMGRVRWLLATNDSAEPSLHIDEAYEGALAVREQLRAAAKQYFVDIDELRQGNVRDIPLICEWQTERRGLDDVRVCTKVRAIDRNFPQWGIDDPDKFNLLLSELNVGAALYNETLGYDRRRWPAYEECKRRMLDKLAVKPENIIPFKPHKDIPDAATNPDWSVATGKAANMDMEAVADKTTLNEAFPRDDNNQPVDKPAKQHETNPDKVPFAVTNHIKRETDITAGVGTFIAKLFPGGLDADKVRELGADNVWATVEAAVAEYNAKPAAKPAEPPAPAAETGAQAAQTTPPAITLPVPTPAPVVAPPSALPDPIKEQSVNYPESPVVVFPQSNGSVVYKGIRFSVTLRAGGTFAMALPLLDDFVKAHESKLIEIDPSCLVNRPATVMLPPAPAPAVTTMPAPAPVAAAPAVSAPASDGGSVRIVEVKKVQDEGAIQYHLFDTAGGDKPSFRLRIENDINKLKQFIDITAMEIGTRYSISVIVDWKPSQKVGQNGKPFRNVATIRAA